MAFSLMSPKNRIINIILNDHSIRYLELKQSNPPVPQRWGERYIPPGIITNGKVTDFDTLTNILEECVEEWKIKKRSIRFVVPDQLVIIRKVSVPSDIEADELKGYLYLELGTSIHLPFEEPVLDIFPLKDNGKTKEVLLFAAPEEYVTEFANVLSSVKLTPVAADITPLSLYRLYHALGHGKENEVLFLVHFTLTAVNLCIFEGSVPVVMRPFSLPFNMEHWTIQRDDFNDWKYVGETEELVIQFEDIFKDISKLIDFYKYSVNQEKKDVSKFLIDGDHPMLAAIVEEMQERFEIPVETLTTHPGIKGKQELPSSLLLTLGLALKEV